LIYPATNAGYLVLPAAAGSGTPPEAADADLATAGRALLALVDPATGQAVVRAVWRPGDPAAPAGIGVPRGGALYFALAPGYSPSPALGDAIILPRAPAGFHVLSPDRPEMRVPFLIAGPGVEAGVDLGTLDLVDIAPTVSALLGIDSPRDASGVAAPAVTRESTSRAGASTQR